MHKVRIFSHGSFIFILAGMLVNFLNYFISIIVSWRLPIEGYGELNALFSLLFILAIPTIIIQTFISNIISEQAKLGIQEPDRETEIFGASVIISLSFIFLLSPFLGILALFLHSTILNTASIFLNVFISFPLAASRGILQGKKNFRSLGKSLALEVVIKTFLVVWGVFFLSFSIPAILFAINIGSFAGLLFTYKSSWFHWKVWKLPHRVFHGNIPYLSHLFFGISGFILLTNIDIVLIRHFIPESAGIYSTLSRLGQVILMGTNIIIGLFLPRYIGHYMKEESTRKIFFLSLFPIFFGGTILVILYYFFASDIVEFLFGSKYLIGSQLLGYFGFSYLLLSISSLIGNYLLALRKYWINIGIGLSLPIYLISILWSHSSLLDFVQSFFISSCFLFLISSGALIFFWYNKNSQKNHLTYRET